MAGFERNRSRIMVNTDWRIPIFFTNINKLMHLNKMKSQSFESMNLTSLYLMKS